ncbi:poly(hydroxyalkanoate) depolymerase family esterase [Litorivivens lipolytica]|uniref:Poly(Hydroxyalkanoate) depolymerase family esterase n=1 Tax=Litorivivens lipolytica TaxID=1524264 RepID=A0A7W4W6B3_9GAMM|nr:PHB depolymerase family esterase [Litorivivens lipolytica]MBB3047684.1 poly(hydroxyalkanoate) depolymerase family esterase [Litorivivens lipolytica]
MRFANQQRGLRRLTVVLAALLLAGCNDSSTTSSNNLGSASFTQHRFSEEGLPERDYYLYVPSSLPANAPLVVYLHGCNQTAVQAAIGTRWNELAEQRGFVVVYPEQKNPNNDEDPAEQTDGHVSDGNGIYCWNWFRPEHQNRDSGEPAAIAGITREVLARSDLSINADQVFLSGMSAGGIMASVMGATYPDLYAAIGVVAGCGYAACGDASGSLAFQTMGEQARRLPVILFHGTADEIAPIAMGEDALQQWLGSNDWIDNGLPDNSVARTPAQTLQIGFDETVFAGVGEEGDTCIRNQNSPCLGGLFGLDSYPTTIERYVDAKGCPLIDFWIIHGLTHNYPGGNPEGNFVDPIGPDITRASYNFFLANPKNSIFERGLAVCQ